MAHTLPNVDSIRSLVLRGQGLLISFALVTMLGVQLLFSGCASSGHPIPQHGAEISAGPLSSISLAAQITKPVSRELVRKLLSKNPDYEPVLIALRDGVDALFLGQREITPEGIKSFVDSLARTERIDSDDRELIAFYILDAYDIYRSFRPDGVMLSTDPNVRRVLQSFRDGIDQGLRFHAAFG